ncbi:hypothetical protein W97_09160 [Coniosporium apollinis CBS 100218]|uniref:Uncharacterized protein n=1 Tax=Coniosporium apollinis (strain CBS 100218) TaxID=1168221 RepID=R7Z7H2_CONA1|nr:uncharacterized protein W97_09160 [Coniosporium apollinis CBS 100218]EON69896.1 hypothetical protein W97_09160 [Coniosporium apollinis CBS 100218]
MHSVGLLISAASDIIATTSSPSSDSATLADRRQALSLQVLDCLHPRSSALHTRLPHEVLPGGIEMDGAFISAGTVIEAPAYAIN